VDVVLAHLRAWMPQHRQVARTPGIGGVRYHRSGMILFGHPGIIAANIARSTPEPA